MSEDIRRVAVTGAAGFIGSHVVDWLLDRGLEVHGCDDLSGGFIENVSADCHFEELDVRDREGVERWIQRIRPQVVYHLAADATEGRSQFTPISATERNLVGYMYVLTSSIRAGVEKMVFVSSLSVYGAQTPPFSEEMPRAPVDIYGLAKASSEHATEILAAVHGLRYTILRPHNVYGPRQCLSDPYRNVVAIFITRALRGEPIYIYGDGEQRRSFTYIDDCAPQIARSGLMTETDGQIINVGASEDYSVNELADALEAAVGSPIAREYVPDRPQEVKLAWCAHERARRIFGDEPTTPLAEGLTRMVEWVREVGIRPMRYLQELEIDSPDAPVTWTKRLI